MTIHSFFGGELCACCGETSGDVPICPRCFDSRLMRLEDGGQRCRSCGRILLSEIGLCAECARKGGGSGSASKIFVLHEYRLWKKRLTFLWKMSGRRRLGAKFAAMLAKFLSSKEELRGLPLVPVPPRPGKLRKKGWDQILDLGNFLKKRHGLKVLPMLERTTAEQQKHLGRSGRRSLSGHSYVPSASYQKRREVPPERVVLIDDVITTGSTVEACSRQLLAMGVREVYAVALFAV